MKIWTEEGCINEYYHWIDQKASTELRNSTVVSINASEIADVNSFADICKKWLMDTYSDINRYSFYLICNVAVKNTKSRVERYKKCWKKLSETSKIDSFELGEEYKMEFEGQLYYSGIARFAFADFDKALSIIDLRQRQFLIFMSKEDFLKDIEHQKLIIDNLVHFDKHQHIDFEIFFEGCIKMNTVAFRYGNVNGEAELAVINSSTSLSI